MDPQKRAALAQIMASGTPPPESPFALNQLLEQQAAPARPELNPMVRMIMERLGLMNMIRNRSNQQVVDPEIPLQ